MCFSFLCLFRITIVWTTHKFPTAFALSSGSYNQANNQSIQTKGLEPIHWEHFLLGFATSFVWLMFSLQLLLARFSSYNFFLLLGLVWQLVCWFLSITVCCSEVVELVVGYFSLVGYSCWMVELFAIFGTQHIIISYLVGLIVDLQLVIVQRHLSVPEGHWSDQQ